MFNRERRAQILNRFGRMKFMRSFGTLQSHLESHKLDAVTVDRPINIAQFLQGHSKSAYVPRIRAYSMDEMST
jgi:hypothetical protein